MKYLFILNPSAGMKDRTREFSKMIDEYFAENGGEYEIAVTQYPGHAELLAREASQSGERYRIYAFGGDGTLSETVSGACGYENVEVGIYPCGTGNDFIKSFPEQLNLFNNLQCLINGKGIQIDLVKCGDRTGINIGNTGFDAEVVRNVYKFKRKFSGALAYTLSVLYCMLFKLTFKMTIKIDNDDIITGRYILVVSANGTTYGGGYKAAPQALPDDGLLDFVVIKSVSRFKLLMLLNKFKKGQHLQFKDLIVYKRGKKITISSDTEFSNTLDGEVFFSKSTEFEVLPKSLKFILPQKVL